MNEGSLGSLLILLLPLLLIIFMIVSGRRRQRVMAMTAARNIPIYPTPDRIALRPPGSILVFGRIVFLRAP